MKVESGSKGRRVEGSKEGDKDEGGSRGRRVATRVGEDEGNSKGKKGERSGEWWRGTGLQREGRGTELQGERREESVSYESNFKISKFKIHHGRAGIKTHKLSTNNQYIKYAHPLHINFSIEYQTSFQNNQV